jgi:hypothetical protein
MKRSWLNPILGGSATLAFTVAGVSVPGCDLLLRDPQTFFAENRCNFFNCDTLFFLAEGHDESPDGATDGHDESESAVDDQ